MTLLRHLLFDDEFFLYDATKPLSFSSMSELCFEFVPEISASHGKSILQP